MNLHATHYARCIDVLESALRLFKLILTSCFKYALQENKS